MGRAISAYIGRRPAPLRTEEAAAPAGEGARSRHVGATGGAAHQALLGGRRLRTRRRPRRPRRIAGEEGPDPRLQSLPGQPEEEAEEDQLEKAPHPPFLGRLAPA